MPGFPGGGEGQVPAVRRKQEIDGDGTGFLAVVAVSLET